MMMKKSLIALAVSSVVVAPAIAQADTTVYGGVNTTYEHTSTSNGGVGGLNFNTTDDEAGIGQSDTWGTRFGFKGSEDIGSNLNASYKLEFDIGTSSNGGGSPNEDSTPTTRLSWIALSGDWGQVKVGTMWGVLYNYAGWNNYRTDGHGGATHYYMTNSGYFPYGFSTSDNPSGLRVDNALQYTWGGGGYSSDPFTFTVQLRSLDKDGAQNNYGGAGFAVEPASDSTVVDSGAAQDDEAIDNVTVGVQGTVAGVTMNATYYQENNASGPDPSMLTLGGRWSPGPYYLGGTFYYADRDQSTKTIVDDNPWAINVLGGMDFGMGYSGYVGLGMGNSDATSFGGQDDDTGNMTTQFLQLQKAFSSQTKVYGELEHVTLDGGNASDPEQTTLAVGLKHTF